MIPFDPLLQQLADLPGAFRHGEPLTLVLDGLRLFVLLLAVNCGGRVLRRPNLVNAWQAPEFLLESRQHFLHGLILS
jgi:hypothetical protein